MLLHVFTKLFVVTARWFRQAVNNTRVNVSICLVTVSRRVVVKSISARNNRNSHAGRLFELNRGVWLLKCSYSGGEVVWWQSKCWAAQILSDIDLIQLPTTTWWHEVASLTYVSGWHIAWSSSGWWTSQTNCYSLGDMNAICSSLHLLNDYCAECGTPCTPPLIVVVGH